MFKVKTKKRRLKKSVKFAILLLIVIIVLLLCKPLFNKNETNKEDSNKTETKLPNNKTDELVKKVLRSKPYFKRNSGGVTFSGGEPLIQIEFLTDVCKKLKKEDYAI